jgi:hypothetical protein
MARRVVRTEYVDDVPEVRRTEVVEDAPVRRRREYEVVEDAPVRRRREYIEDDAPMVRRSAPMMGMPIGALIGLAIVAVLLLMLLLGRV